MKHKVRQGECLPSIAARYGFAWKTLWDHPGNAALRGQRKAASVLLPGDEVEIPERQPGSASAPTGGAASFVMPGMQLRVRLVDRGEPLSGIACKVDLEGTRVEGTTDGQGMLEIALPRKATRATLTLAGRTDEITLLLGNLDPVTEVTGQQWRLRNLGFYDGDADGKGGDALRGALADFQQTHGLDPTGGADTATLQRLVEDHGC